MKSTLALFLGFGLAASVGTAAAPDDAIRKGNPPIVAVKKALYKKHPRPRPAALVSVQYVGPKLERREWQGVEINDDVHDNQVARWSLDNGRTWSDFVPLQPSSKVIYKGVTVWEGGGGGTYDPTTGVLVDMW